MKRIINFALVVTSKAITAMETAKEELNELAKKAQKPSASGNLRSLTNCVKNLYKIELIEEKDKKQLTKS